MTILVITDPSTDGHLSPVLEELGPRGYDVQVLDPGAFPESASIVVDSTSSGLHSVIRWAGQEIDLATVGSVWYRRPGKFALPDELLPQEKEWLRGECAALLNGIYATTEALWVSDPHALRRADLKLLQLQLARQLGLRVPAYTVTNDPERARSFLADHPEGVIVKALSLPTIMRDDRAGMIYTHLITPDDAAQLDSVRYGPTFLQAFAPKARDIRVTVIGDEIFAVGIASMTTDAARVDFRKAEIFDLPHEPLTLPAPIATACLGLVKALGLQFGAIDLLETSAGEFVFLENNPNGQWYWIELMTGQPMARAMADLLERGERERGHQPNPKRTFIRSPRKPQIMPVGEVVSRIPSSSTVTAGESEQRLKRVVATSAWMEKKRDAMLLHIGDMDDAT